MDEQREDHGQQSQHSGSHEGRPIGGQVGYLMAIGQLRRTDGDDHRGQDRDADGATQLARGVEHRRGAPHVLHGDGREGGGLGRREGL